MNRNCVGYSEPPHERITHEEDFWPALGRILFFHSADAATIVHGGPIVRNMIQFVGKADHHRGQTEVEIDQWPNLLLCAKTNFKEASGYQDVDRHHPRYRAYPLGGHPHSPVLFSNTRLLDKRDIMLNVV